MGQTPMMIRGESKAECRMEDDAFHFRRDVSGNNATPRPLRSYRGWSNYGERDVGKSESDYKEDACGYYVPSSTATR